MFLDQDAIPTLVEVKKGANTDIRRKVVGQMLDYAANAITYWQEDQLQAPFLTRCEREGIKPSDFLDDFLNEEMTSEEFWHQAKINLRSGRIRLIFISDVIPAELRRIVEFLNAQMDPAEVFAIEVKQFVGEGTRTLVPQLIGQTEILRREKSLRGDSVKQWDETGFLSALEFTAGTKVRDFAEQFLRWIAPQVTLIWWGTGSKEGGAVPTVLKDGTKYHLCRLSTRGWFVFRFDWLCGKPPFDSDSVRKHLLHRINAIPGVNFSDEIMTKHARIRIDQLTDAEASERLRAVILDLLTLIESVS
ncbi:hypothetical protein SH661x_000670 [Planctomicrobium sp. SH661]|uniref:hypothetical protein n=1 Tax=Planctomicrobium sp. SH661 TaxID=3448124 RepID=UPI003F5C49BC